MPANRTLAWWLQTPIYAFRHLWNYCRSHPQLWTLIGRPVPPPHRIKQSTVFHYGAKMKTLVETGTFQGAMVNAALKKFEAIHSVELSDELYNRAKIKFADSPNVHLHLGDSAVVLPELIKTLDEPVIFWLDGHAMDAADTAHSGEETPICNEINSILTWANAAPSTCGRSVLLIDDARYLGTENWPTIEEIRKTVRAKSPQAKVEVKDDIVRIVL